MVRILVDAASQLLDGRSLNETRLSNFFWDGARVRGQVLGIDGLQA